MKRRVRFVIPIIGITREDGSILCVEKGQVIDMTESELEGVPFDSFIFESKYDVPTDETPTTTHIFNMRIGALHDLLISENHNFPSPEHCFSALAAYPLAVVRSWSAGSMIPMYAWRSLNLICAMAELNGVEGLMHASLNPIESELELKHYGLRHYHNKRSYARANTGQLNL